MTTDQHESSLKKINRSHAADFHTVEELQEREKSLIYEIEERKLVEEELRKNQIALNDFFENSIIGLHLVGPDGIILRANKAELELLGYEKSEYVGRHIAEFHVDNVVIDDILERLTCRQTLTNYPARLKCKNGSIKHVLIDSNVYFEDGKFIHTRCFTRDVTAQREAQAALFNSEILKDAILDSSDDCIKVLDLDAKIQFMNKGGLKQLEISNYHQLRKKCWFDFWQGENKINAMRIFNSATSGSGDQFTGELRLSGKPSSYWSVAAAPIRDANQKVIQVLITSRDITAQVIAQRQNEEKLANERKKLEAIFYGADFPMVLFRGPDLIYEMANQKYLELISFRDVIGKSLIEALPEISESEFPKKIKKVHDTGEPVRFLEGYTPILNPKTGELEDRYFDTTFARISDDSDEGYLVIGNAMDVTERVRTRIVLEEAKRDAERANELKSAFLANMSHEIRTPLGAMVGFADLLRDPELSTEEHSNFIDILTRNGEQLSMIINDILDLSKVEAGHLTLEYCEMLPDEIAADVVSLLSVKALEKGLTLEFEADSSTPSVVVSDPLRVRQVVTNVIANAIKFTQTGGIKIRSFGSIDQLKGQMLYYEITDTGIGIPENEKERIFEAFVQADGTLARRFGGTGLGLALSRKLARSLGGDVFISKTAEGKGSTFLIMIQDLPSLKSVAKAGAQSSANLEISEDALSGMNILVVDDSPDNRQLLGYFLMKYGATSDFADNGLTGFRKALGGKYDLVLMDIQMPEMDGYTATQKLREAGFQKPVIALTAHAMSEVRKKCLYVGCNAHLAKPIKPQELISTIARLGPSGGSKN